MRRRIFQKKEFCQRFCYFLFYLGHLERTDFFLRRYASAILFILTIGGCGIWWIIDFILIVTGSMKDDKGKLVKLWVD